MAQTLPDAYPFQIKKLRGRMQWTKERLAEYVGVSFTTVTRWENALSKPSSSHWNKIRELHDAWGGNAESHNEAKQDKLTTQTEDPPLLDFTTEPEIIRAAVEGVRLSYGHLSNPAFATEISQIAPLPHQRIAVYDYMVKQHRLRFLLADDAGAGKTIMAGLYIREMLSRRRISRVLIAPPAGLTGNWEREMNKLFRLPFHVVEGGDAKDGNPFAGKGSKLIIVSLDTLAGARMFGRLRESSTAPYDLIIFDEAHKLSADRSADFRIRKTDRYRLAESLAGVSGKDRQWRLGWQARHLLLLTATPHMGKAYPYFALWRLLEPEVFTTPETLEKYSWKLRNRHFIRRTKEEMVNFDGSPLYPQRISDTLTYDLNPDEQHLYQQTTEYLKLVYNRAKLLNRSAARLVMGVFQRRLASSTYAVLKSLERRSEKLKKIVDDIMEGRISFDQLMTLQQRMSEADDILESKTADEEAGGAWAEENELAEEKTLQAVIATSLTDLISEQEYVTQLIHLAQCVIDAGTEAKFDRLHNIIASERYQSEKIIIFTEHKDTLNFLIRRIEGMGYTGQTAQIHGGMHYKEREAQVELFRKPAEHGGARFMVATDAAGEGINLQFCWLMINYDIPWNPARLEQRMGRIHRYGQKHDPVVIINLVADKTREGRVLKTLLEKLEKIREELGSDKVFDVIGRAFEDVSIKDYMMRIMDDSGAEEATTDIDRQLTSEGVLKLFEKERRIYGVPGDVSAELPRLRESMSLETYKRLLPGYVMGYLQKAAPMAGLRINGDLCSCFSFAPLKPGTDDDLHAALDAYTPEQQGCLSVHRPAPDKPAIWMHPGETVFERFRALVAAKTGRLALRGGVFVDPAAQRPYLFHVALISVIRKADAEIWELAHEDPLETRLYAFKQFEDGKIRPWPVEHLLLMIPGRGLPRPAQRMAAGAFRLKQMAEAWLHEEALENLIKTHRERFTEDLSQRTDAIRQGFSHQEAELAEARSIFIRKVKEGKSGAMKELEKIKTSQKRLSKQRTNAIEAIRREPELIIAGPVEFIAHALMVPSSDPEDKKQHNLNVEGTAMKVVRAYEEARGAVVREVHTPPLARAAGLTDFPGFDILSVRPDGHRRDIEVKGRAGTGEIEVSDNEWAKACNSRETYWIYVVYDCATEAPNLLKVSDPFGKLLVKARGGVRISKSEINKAATTSNDA